MGGGQYAGSAPSYNQNVGQMMQDYIQYLPQLAQVTAAQQPGIDVSQARGAAAAAPITNQAALDMFGRFAPALAAIGQRIGASNAQAGQQTNTGLLTNPNATTSTGAALSLEQQANPQYYSVMNNAAGKANDLMNSINLKGLSGGEQAAVERSLGQSNTATGSLGLDNATTAVGNAMTFGNALQAKRDALASAIGTATNFLPQSKASFDPVSLALGQNPSTTTSTNMAASQYPGIGPAGNQAFAMGNNTLSNLNTSNIANMGMQYSANQANSFGGILGSQTSAIGNVCCFIFLESYHGELPWWIRKCRDRYYHAIPEVADGYRRMARWLVPMMRKSPIVRFLVWYFMVQPLTMYGQFVCRVSGYQEHYKRYKVYRKFWFTIWKILGRK